MPCGDFFLTICCNQIQHNLFCFKSKRERVCRPVWEILQNTNMCYSSSSFFLLWSLNIWYIYIIFKVSSHLYPPQLIILLIFFFTIYTYPSLLHTATTPVQIFIASHCLHYEQHLSWPSSSSTFVRWSICVSLLSASFFKFSPG